MLDPRDRVQLTTHAKPHVERQVQYLRENFFRGEAWLGRDHVQRQAVRWCVEVAGQRVHGTTRKRPFAVFESTEKPALQASGAAGRAGRPGGGGKGLSRKSRRVCQTNDAGETSTPEAREARSEEKWVGIEEG